MHWDRHPTSQFDMGLAPQATYLSPRPERALGKVPLEQPPRLQGPESWAPGPRRLRSTLLPPPGGAVASAPELTLDQRTVRPVPPPTRQLPGQRVE